MAKTQKTLPSLHSSAAIEAAYQKKLQKIINCMSNSVAFWLERSYRRNIPEISKLSYDSSPAVALQRTIRALARRWQRRINDLAPKLADYFATSVSKRSDSVLKRILRDGGFSVEFKRTRAMNDAMQASIHENVALIKSIPSQYFTQIEGMVMRSVQDGASLGEMADELKKRYGITTRRAKLITKDQNNKLNGVVQRVRMQEAGITHAQWVHSHAGFEPRPTHVKASKDKVVYKISEGWYDPAVKKHIQPGSLVNCLPESSVVEFAAGCKKLWRRRYHGELTSLVTESGKTLNATPNHPVLTQRGWVPVQDVNLGEYVFEIPLEVLQGVDMNTQCNDITIAQLFDTTARYMPINVSANGGWFHGDATDQEIDVIDIDGFLPSELDPAFLKKFLELFFSDAYMVVAGSKPPTDRTMYQTLVRLFGAPHSIVSGFCTILPLLDCHLSHTDDISFALAARLNTCFEQSKSYGGTTNAVLFRDGFFTHSGEIVGNDVVIRQLFSAMARASVLWNGQAPAADSLGEIIGVNGQMPRDSQKRFATIGQHKQRVVNKGVREFKGHVFNLETWSGYYTTEFIITQNCRCTSRPVLPIARSEN